MYSSDEEVSIVVDKPCTAVKQAVHHDARASIVPALGFVSPISGIPMGPAFSNRKGANIKLLTMDFRMVLSYGSARSQPVYIFPVNIRVILFKWNQRYNTFNVPSANVILYTDGGVPPYLAPFRQTEMAHMQVLYDRNHELVPTPPAFGEVSSQFKVVSVRKLLNMDVSYENSLSTTGDSGVYICVVPDYLLNRIEYVASYRFIDL